MLVGGVYEAKNALSSYAISSGRAARTIKLAKANRGRACFAGARCGQGDPGHTTAQLNIATVCDLGLRSH